MSLVCEFLLKWTFWWILILFLIICSSFLIDKFIPFYYITKNFPLIMSLKKNVDKALDSINRAKGPENNHRSSKIYPNVPQIQFRWVLSSIQYNYIYSLIHLTCYWTSAMCQAFFLGARDRVPNKTGEVPVFMEPICILARERQANNYTI